MDYQWCSMAKEDAEAAAVDGQGEAAQLVKGTLHTT